MPGPTLFTMNATISDFVAPDFIAPTGMSVHFTLNIPPGDLLRLLGDAPQLVSFRQAVGYIRSDGRMWDRPAVSPSPLDLDDPGELGVRLLADDPNFQIQPGISYLVRIKRISRGRGQSLRSFYTPVVPSVDTPVDLASFAPGPGGSIVSVPEIGLVDHLSDARAAGKNVVRSSTGAEVFAALGGWTTLGDVPVDHLPSFIGDATSFGIGLLTGDAEAARTALGIYGVGELFNWRPDNTRRIQRSIAKALAGLTADHVVCGDSISQSYTGAQTYTAVWPYLARQLLSLRGIPLAGTGWVMTGNASTYGKDPRLTLTGTWADSNGSLSTSESGATLTFKSDLPGTTVEIAYPSTGGVFTVSIDGGTATTVTPSGGALALQKATFSGLTDQTHEVLISRSSGTVVVYAVKCARSAGLQIHNMSCIGMTAQNWASDATTPRITGWVTRRIGVLSTADVMHIPIGVNDLHYSRTPAQVVADVATMAAQAPNADIVLHAEIAPNPANTGTPTQVSTATWQDYVARLKVLALTLDCPLVDVNQWAGGSYAAAAANGLMADGYHPTKTAHGWWGLLVANAIAGKV